MKWNIATSQQLGAAGGIFLNGGGLSFSTVKGNFGVGGGGGVYAVGAYFDRCTISGNTSMAGGGISASNSTLDRTIVWGN